MKNQKIYGIVIICLILGFTGGYFTREREGSDENVSGSPTETEGGIKLETNMPGVTVDVLKENESSKTIPTIPAPSLDRTMGLEKMTEETRKSWKAVIDNLRADPTSFSDWLELGLIRSSVGDYEGAESAWVYAAAIVPGNSVVYGNLGHLYTFYLKDYVKAEANYRRAITNNPSQEYLYFQLFELFNDVMKDKKKARAFLDEAVKLFPASTAIAALRAEFE